MFSDLRTGFLHTNSSLHQTTVKHHPTHPPFYPSTLTSNSFPWTPTLPRTPSLSLLVKNSLIIHVQENISSGDISSITGPSVQNTRDKMSTQSDSEFFSFGERVLERHPVTMSTSTCGLDRLSFVHSGTTRSQKSDISPWSWFFWVRCPHDPPKLLSHLRDVSRIVS